MKYICAVCGREFEMPRGNHKYCGEDCRKKGKSAIRKQWEKDTDYNERMRIASANRRAKRKGDNKPVKLRETPIPVKKDGLSDRLFEARASGDHRKYWETFQRYEINFAERQGQFSRCKVNGISVYHPQFVDLVLESIAREQRIVTTH